MNLLIQYQRYKQSQVKMLISLPFFHHLINKKTNSFDWEKITLINSLLCSLVALYFSYKTGAIISYNDAMSHLNIARRVTDSLTPGFAQLGSVWLPLMHALEIPLVTNNFLWQSGLAGSIISGISFIFASFFLYKLIYLATSNQKAAFVGTSFFIFNPNILFLQTTALLEPLLICTVIASTYYTAKWVIEFELGDFILASLFTLLATLTRYDGWALFLAQILFIYAIVLAKKRQLQGLILLFLFFSGYGILLWIIYNWVILSDPFYFARSEFSAAAQQASYAQHGLLPTKHNLLLSFYTYFLTVVLNVGSLTTIAFLFGIVSYLRDNYRKIERLTPLLLVTFFPFNIISLFLGQSVIFLPLLPPYFSTYFNVRYGIMLLPLFCFAIGYLSNKKKSLFPILLTVLFLQTTMFIFPLPIPNMGKKGIITLIDAQSTLSNETIQASEFLKSRYDNGLILISTGADPLIFKVGIPLKKYITEGNQHFWKDSLEDPTTYAKWIVLQEGDDVSQKIKNSNKLVENYKLIYSNKIFKIWKRN